MSRLVVFSFFRYSGLRVPDAFLRMGFQRFLIDRRMPTGRIRLMGSGDGFSVVPDLGAYCLMRVFADPGDEARLSGVDGFRCALPILRVSVFLKRFSGKMRFEP
ncbi:MAG: hypothetical protein KFB96_02690 [Thiocapsa sp.]|uniref:hypothetical protein n=1 Tax=Thiocapsa sp. TaxID=2024551 RepID=UPI001BCE1EBA|nr:hypothetical protein [Thiocapsa sp.]QVL49447.1 MAG: hypothetical protein KFB96_02690 [Thiocapsa sp.]